MGTKGVPSILALLVTLSQMWSVHCQRRPVPALFVRATDADSQASNRQLSFANASPAQPSFESERQLDIASPGVSPGASSGVSPGASSGVSPGASSGASPGASPGVSPGAGANGGSVG